MGEYTPEEFDRQVAALRGKVEPAYTSKPKAASTPDEWAANLEYRKAKMRKFRELNPEKNRASSRKWQRKNRERASERCRRWRAENPERSRALVRKWQEANRDKTRAQAIRWKAEARATNPAVRLADRLRSRLKLAIKGNFKSGSAVRDLGCTIAELWSHLESKFQPGMTRDNMGAAWHLDHIYPMSQANLQDRPQFLAVNNWRNLQPLSPADNIAKNDSVSCEAQALFDQLCTEFA